MHNKKIIFLKITLSTVGTFRSLSPLFPRTSPVCNIIRFLVTRAYRITDDDNDGTSGIQRDTVASMIPRARTQSTAGARDDCFAVEETRSARIIYSME